MATSRSGSRPSGSCWSSLEEDDFQGEVVAIPVANPYAFQSLTRNTPLDMTNLNRVFPGDPDGA